MARRCLKCSAPISPRPEGNPKGVAYAEPDGTPVMLTVLYECRCGSHQSVVLWQDEGCALDDFEEAAAADLYERDEAPLDRATYRPFFSLTHELAERGL